MSWPTLRGTLSPVSLALTLFYLCHGMRLRRPCVCSSVFDCSFGSLLRLRGVAQPFCWPSPLPWASQSCRLLVHHLYALRRVLAATTRASLYIHWYGGMAAGSTSAEAEAAVPARQAAHYAVPPGRSLPATGVLPPGVRFPMPTRPAPGAPPAPADAGSTPLDQTAPADAGSMGGRA